MARENQSIRRSEEQRYDPDAIRSATRKRLLSYARISIAFGLLILLGGMGLMFVLVGASGTREQFQWGLLEGLTGLMSLAIVAGSIVFVAKEYIENEVQRTLVATEASFSMYKEIFERITDPDDTAARRWIIRNIPLLDDDPDDAQFQKWLAEVNARLDDRPDGWTGDMPPGRAYLKRVLTSFDYLGYVEQHYWKVEDSLVEWLGPPVVKVWERIEPYVEHEAFKRGEDDFYRSAREFGQMCVEHRRAQGYGRSNIIDSAT